MTTEPSDTTNVVDLDKTPGGELVGGPASGTIRRITHQQGATGSEQGSGDRHHHTGSSKTPGSHHIGGQAKFVDHTRGVDFGHHHPFCDIQCTNRVAQQVGSLGTTFDEHQVEVGTSHTDHQRRQSTARPQIDHAPRIGGQRRDEVVGVRNGIDQVDGADRPAPLYLAEDSPKFVVVSHWQAR